MGFMKEVVSNFDLERNDALSQEQKSKQLGSERYKVLSYPGWEKMYEAGIRKAASYWEPPDPDTVAPAHPNAVWRAILEEKPYPVKAMIMLAANPLLTLPNPLLIKKALKKLEILVVMDYYLTPTAQLADYVFPAASTVERADIVARGAFCFPCPKGLDPLYERKPDYFFWRELGIRCGQESEWPWETIEDVLDYRLAPLGMTFQELEERGVVFAQPEFKKYEKEGFATPSGKVEITSSIFDDLGYEKLPAFKDVTWPWKEDSDLVLMTGNKFLPMYHSEQRQWPSARKQMPDPLVTLNPETASNLGLHEGEWVEIETPFGKITQKLKVSDTIHPRMVDVQHGWWFPEKEGKEPVFFDAFKANANVLCPTEDQYLSPEIGAWPHTGLPVRVRKAT
jgi:anaerobic selenocysteine-containing dehydrogenase